MTAVTTSPITDSQAALTPAQRALLQRLAEAERHVWRVFPEVIATVLADELRAVIATNARFDTWGRAARLVEEILVRPGVEPPPPPVGGVAALIERMRAANGAGAS